jgi:hypothetical protein
LCGYLILVAVIVCRLLGAKGVVLTPIAFSIVLPPTAFAITVTLVTFGCLTSGAIDVEGFWIQVLDGHGSGFGPPHWFRTAGVAL